ncbi:hypothetical protein DFP73DRAFT_589209 [Morchella snyderi]|nr:hypothetical protein DFP73DRAFT_589209 [Morchella snyderi]
MPEEEVYVDENYFKVGDFSLGLRRVYPDREKLGTKAMKSKNFFVDIIAIHGLGADAFETWTSSDDEKTMWIRDILPGYIQEEVIDRDDSDIRVLTFGYDSSIFVHPALAQTKRMTNFADKLLVALKDDGLRRSDDGKIRPIIFLCHSLGGLVVKQAIIKARSNPAYENIFKSIKAIYFFSTPHDGADVKAWAEVLGRLSNSLGMANTSSAAKALGTWSSELIDLTQNFVHPGKDISMISYYEGRAEPGGVVVVNEGSVKALQANRHSITELDATYREMCRFTDVEENNANVILPSLQGTIDDIYNTYMNK